MATLIRARCEVVRKLVQQHVEYDLTVSSMLPCRSPADVSRRLEFGIKLLAALEQLPDLGDNSREEDESMLIHWVVDNAEVLVSAPLCVEADSALVSNEKRVRLAHHLCVILLGLATSVVGAEHACRTDVMEAYKALLPVATRAVPVAS